ncbi:ribokinase [Opitutaceae bacterium TAV5]|nr:ribokinase [Opitutaceae bacterium TAV5]
MSVANTTRHAVAIVGSANMDLSIPVTCLPRTGETILGGDMTTNPGGKGANQAVAAQRAASRPGFCRFVGRVGDDVFGRQLRNALDADSVDTAALLTTPGAPSGTAAIMVNPEGDNAIVVSPGANARLTPADIAGVREAITTAAVLTVQLEVPFDTVAAALSLAREAGVLTILDPAPAPQPASAGALATLPDALWQVDIFSPNQSEARLLTGIAVDDLDSARAAGERLLQFGPKTVVLKLGGLGAAIITAAPSGGGQGGNAPVFTHIPAIRIPAVVDTTAAGDTFTGALATALAEGRSLAEAVRFAGIAGSLACTVRGAQSAIPHRRDILARL